MKERRKLFSDVPPAKPRRKLFSEEPKKEIVQEAVLCSDCGHKLSEEELSIGYCKVCGANIQIRQRRSLFEEDFQKEFSNTDDPLELKLKDFSGKEISKDLYEKEFSDTERTNLEERGFSKVTEDGGIKISNTAFLESRLFSKLVVSVTKEYDLIPDIMQNRGNFGHYIDSLNTSPKCIAILKKVHGVKGEGDNEGWMEDSGILNDIPAEFGGQTMSKPEFTNLIEERYPDAPEDIIEKLKSLGIIGDNDDNIEIK